MLKNETWQPVPGMEHTLVYPIMDRTWKEKRRGKECAVEEIEGRAETVLRHRTSLIG